MIRVLPGFGVQAPLDIKQLGRTFSGASATGEDVRAGARVELYYRLKDARSAARSQERNLDPGQPFRLSAAWGDVRSISIEILDTISKDLEVLSWLCEAELRLGGFDGLRQTFLLSASLVRESFADLHSIDGDGIEDKVAPFAGLNGQGGEGTLIQPIRLSPLVPGAPFFRDSLWDFQMAQRPGEEARRKALLDAAADAGPTAMRAHLDEVKACGQAFAELCEAFDVACGADAPASSNVRSVLEEARLAIVNISGLSDDGPALAVADEPPRSGALLPAARDGAREMAAPGPIGSREEAFDRLLEVARYFRRAEPQSPLAAAIETVVERGRMDFAGLLGELVQDEHMRRTILIAAGIRPQSDGSA